MDLEDVSRLVKKLDDEAKRLGLYLQDVAIIPPVEGRPLLVQGVFALGERAEEAGKDEEQSRIDQEFNDLMRASKKDEFDQARQQLEDDFKNGRGLFGDG